MAEQTYTSPPTVEFSTGTKAKEPEQTSTWKKHTREELHQELLDARCAVLLYLAEMDVEEAAGGCDTALSECIAPLARALRHLQ